MIEKKTQQIKRKLSNLVISLDFFFFTREQHKPGRTYGVGLDVGNQYVELIDG